MNCPSRNDETSGHDGWNQSPPAFAADSTTRQDLNGIVNSRLPHDHRIEPGENEMEGQCIDAEVQRAAADSETATTERRMLDVKEDAAKAQDRKDLSRLGGTSELCAGPESPHSSTLNHENSSIGFFRQISRVAVKFGKFVGPGFMVSVAYIDPGNYSTDVAAGATFKYRLLFIILMSNLFAIFLQSLCVKLGTVTGMNLAEHCRANFPGWLNISLYIFAESAIIATDIAEVIGSAIALNLLLKIPLVAGCAITIVDVVIILLFYNPTGSMRRLRAFEFFVVALVLGVVVCFCIQLSLLQNTSIREVFKGYLPSSTIIQSQGLYQSCGILGATVMPHSLFLGSGVVQARLREFDTKLGNIPATSNSYTYEEDDKPRYQPSLPAIRFCLKYSTIEVIISLFTFALFVNSAILIVAGSSLSDTPEAQNADLFGIHALLAKSIAPIAGTIFALALLLSGTSAGIVATIAGQMVSEGQLNWTVAPWVRRLVTRSISITPSIIIAGAVGAKGLSAALNGTQVALSVILPFVSAPLIYFTCRNKFMTVSTGGGVEPIQMRNHWMTTVLAVLIWLVIVIMNVALLVLVGLGKTLG